MASDVNDLILEFLAEIDEGFAMLREMSRRRTRPALSGMAAERHPDRFSTLQLPLSEAAE